MSAADPTPPSQTPPDQPPVPRAHPLRRVAVWLALVFTLGMTGGYAVLGFTQRQLGTDEHQEVPASVRASPGGYRSFHFWHSGYHGGK